MKNKILLELYVPAIEKKYEVFVPISKNISKITILLIKSVNELSDGSFPISNNIKLYDMSLGKEIDEHLLVKNSSLVNGSKVMLV